MKVSGSEIDWRFDRVVKVTIKCPNIWSETKKNKAGELVATPVNEVVIMYDPLTNENLVPRIDFTTDTITQLDDLCTPSYSAEIKLYNITDSVANAIASKGVDIINVSRNKNTTNEKRREILQKPSGRPSIKLEVGYHGDENLSLLFDGYINSTFSTRVGTDYVTTLQCWKFDGSLPNSSAGSLGIDVADAEESALYIKEKNEDLYNCSTFDELVYKLLTIYGDWMPIKEDTPENKLTAMLNPSNEVSSLKSSSFETSTKDISPTSNSYVRLPMVEYLKNYDIKNGASIYYVTDVKSMTPYPELGVRVREATTNISFRADGETDLVRLLHTAAARTRLNIDCVEKKNPPVAFDNNGTPRRIFAVYEIGKEKGGVKGSTLVIKNYQNIVEPPVIGGNGSLSVKMMLEPAVAKYDNIELVIDTNPDNASDAYADFSNSFTGMNSIGLSAGVGRFVPLVSGDYAASVMMQDQKSRGNIFNYPFGIWKVVHTGSTHTKDWYTNVFSYPSFLGKGEKRGS